MSSLLLSPSSAGLFCPRGQFFIDPHQPVSTALVTHGHADHVALGSRNYLTTTAGEGILRQRIGPRASLETIPYGTIRELNGVEVSFHPAGHILGSSQIRIACQGEVWVVSGDYHLAPDPTCTSFESIPCDTFVTESTFGHPQFQWTSPREVLSEIEDWWRHNQREGRTSLLFAYALGKSQRILAGIDPTIGPIHVHAQVDAFNAAYRAGGIHLPETVSITDLLHQMRPPVAFPLVIAPPTLIGTPWTRRFGPVSTAFVSGWMLIPGSHVRRCVERGFALSDHADHAGLLHAIRATKATRIFTMHGYAHRLADELRSFGLAATPLIADALDPIE